MYINRAIIVGNLTRDPEIKQLPNGNMVADFSVATNRSYKNQQGEKVDKVEFHNVVAFGKTAEVISQYMTKGQSIGVEGRLETSSWEKDGVKKYKTTIIVESMSMGARKESTPKGSIQTDPNHVETTEEEINPDDIPF